MSVPSPARASTFILKAVILLIAAAVCALCAFLFPAFWTMGFRELPELSHLLYPALIGFYATSVPFFFALYQAFRLLQYMDANNAFSASSVRALRTIKHCAIAMSALYACGMPLAVVVFERDDAPGGILMACAVVCAPLIVATFAAVLQKLIQNALAMKMENDFTI